MSIESNKWLEKYEIKRPDIDFKKRNSEKKKQLHPHRYELTDEVWVSKQKKKGLFGKKKATILFTGDIACFDKQFEVAQVGDRYDFEYAFEQVKPIFKKADLVVGNLETAIVPEAPYRSEKIVIEENFYCNAPLEFLSAIKKSGIDVVTTANNHDLDTGAVGLGETIDNIERYGFIHTGTFKTDKRRYELFDVNGIRVGIVAYATDHNALSCNIKPEGIEKLLNDYTKEAARSAIEEMRNAGAEIVIAYMHWGKENKTEVHKDQIKISNQLAYMGYDCVVGSHPHVLQKFEVIKIADREMPVFFSLGNFISQNYNNIKARSALACIEIEKKRKNVKLHCSYVPIYTCGSYKGKKLVVLPIKENSKGRKASKTLERIKNEIGFDVSVNRRFVKEDLIEDNIKKKRRRRPQELNLSTVKEFPVEYNDGFFNYLINEDDVCFVGIDEAYVTVSCTVPEKIHGLPVNNMVDGAFEGNTYLKKVKAVGFPYIGKRMFKNCASLEGFRMGLHTREVREEAFANCVNLQSAIMKKGLERINTRAFAGCTNLLSAKIPANVSYISDNAFENCPRLTIYCDKGSYAERYANEHNIKIVYMNVY
ncbi:MAG TPA: leucine-rich repeat protein [Mogibacterium sp.]|nr:leucine-rich repeat protein [Mogibacterium sp.]